MGSILRIFYLPVLIHWMFVQGEDATKDIDSLSREDLGREIGSRWTGKKTEQQNHDVDDVKNDDRTSVDVQDEESNGYDTETEEDHQNYDEDDTEEHMDDVADEANDDSSSSYNYEPDEEVDMLGKKQVIFFVWVEADRVGWVDLLIHFVNY
jgi:protein kinase C substrate 80K-H